MPIVRLENFQQFAAINVLSDPGAVGGPVVIPNCVQVVLQWNLAGGKIARNIMYGRVGGIPSPTVAQADAIFSALGSGAQWTALALTLHTTTQFAGVTLRSVHAANQAIVQSTGPAKPGTASAGTPMPAEVAICVTLRTALAGISNRGRLYAAGFAEGSGTSAGVVGASVVTALQNWANTITAALSAQGYTWAIGKPARKEYIGSTGTVHPARSAGSEPITSAVVRNNTWDSQRRRGLR